MGDADELGTGFREVLAAEMPATGTVAFCAGDEGMSASLWRTIASLGWLALPLSEPLGVGLGLDALAALHRELGRAVAPVPAAGTLLVAQALAAAGASDMLAGLAAGELTAAVATGPLSARREGAKLVCAGSSTPALDGGVAELFLVRVALGEGSGWLALRRTELAVAPLRPVDRTRTLATVVLDGLRIDAARLVAIDEDALDLSAAITIAADALGAAEGALDLAIDHLKTREQFGRPIGSFQALKHRVADHRAALVVADAGLAAAIAHAGAGAPSLIDVLAAKAHCTAIAIAVTRDVIQLHGGIGFTAEHPAHLYLARAMLDGMMFGTLAQTLDRVGRGLAA